MTVKEKINKQKDFIVKELRSWATTFIDSMPNSDDEDNDGFDIVMGLAERLENGNCTDKDYKEIDFHIMQINAAGLRIVL